MRHAGHQHLGILTSPAAGNRLESIASSGMPWAADNGAFSGLDEAKFSAMVERIRRVDRSRLLWVVAPDVVADARATMDSWQRWQPLLTDLPLAFVAQNGQESLPVPWEQMACLFVGGSTEWKLSPMALALVREAKRRGKWVHNGRVNTLRRLRISHDMGCDSCDGTSMSRFADTYLPDYLAFCDGLARQASLW